MVLSAIAIIGHICCGMDGKWVVTEIGLEKKSKKILYKADVHPTLNEDNAILKLFYTKADGKDNCVAELHINEKVYKVPSIDMLSFENRENNYYDQVYVTLSQNDNEKRVVVKKVEKFYGPPKYYNALSAYVVAGSDSVTFRYKDQKGLSEIELYQNEHVKKIREELAKNEQFIVKLEEKEEVKIVRVAEYTSGSYIWWDGWRPMTMWKIFSYGCVGMPYEPKPTADPAIIKIDLNEDKKAESQYRFNKNVTYASIFALGVGVLYLFKDRIERIISAVFASSKPDPVRVFVKEDRCCEGCLLTPVGLIAK